MTKGRSPRPAARLGALAFLSLATALVFSLAASLTACTIDRRSDALACQRTTDCSDGRVCVDAYCVLGDDGGGGGSNAECPEDCTRCEGGTCYRDCMNEDCRRFSCPEGWKCNVTCGANRCRDIDCDEGDCEITCAGTNACGDITCGQGRCAVTCDGVGACKDVECEEACSCQVTCATVPSCQPLGASCPAQCDAGNGCNGSSAACNTCE